MAARIDTVVKALTGFKPIRESAALVAPDSAESLSPEMAPLGTVAA